MQKTGRPWYRRGNDSWYVWFNGKQVMLAKGRKNKAAAHARFAELIGAEPPPTPPPRPVLTVSGLVEAYKVHIKERIKPATYISYGVVLASLVKSLGDCPASDLQASALENWARGQDWSSTTQRFALTVAGGAFRWAERAGLLPANPIRHLHKPTARSRGAEILVDPDLHARLLEVVSPEFRDFLEAVHATGARPGEIARLEASNIVWDAACAVLREHKTARTGRVRTIYLPAATLELCRRLAVKNTTGPLFLNTKGEPWRKTGWKQAMARAQRKLGLPRRPLTSGYRHSFATDALESGVPDAHVAELLGHASTAMVHRHYGHLAAKARTLRQALDRVRK